MNSFHYNNVPRNCGEHYYIQLLCSTDSNSTCYISFQCILYAHAERNFTLNIALCNVNAARAVTGVVHYMHMALSKYVCNYHVCNKYKLYGNACVELLVCLRWWYCYVIESTVRTSCHCKQQSPSNSDRCWVERIACTTFRWYDSNQVHPSRSPMGLIRTFSYTSNKTIFPADAGKMVLSLLCIV